MLGYGCLGYHQLQLQRKESSKQVRTHSALHIHKNELTHIPVVQGFTATPTPKLVIKAGHQ